MVWTVDNVVKLNNFMKRKFTFTVIKRLKFMKANKFKYVKLFDYY